MPTKEKALNVRAVPARLMREIKAAAGKKGVTVKDWVIEVLGEKVGVVGVLPEPEETPTGKTEESALNPEGCTHGLRDGEGGDSRQSVRVRRAVERPATDTAEVSAESKSSRFDHDPKTCNLYGCLMCKMAKE
jgi:hypothetical protein